LVKGKRGSSKEKGMRVKRKSAGKWKDGGVEVEGRGKREGRNSRR